MGRRAEALAARIEQGAAELAKFVESISDSEWHKPISTRDVRPVGVHVHHVAFVYPIEVDLAKTIGSGKPAGVTWDDVAKLNAGHATDQASVSKEAALALLRENSRQAAAAIREFTDEQLDTAAPFGLSYGAPVTAQFVIEDHAVRHSWHHLAKIRSALGR